MPIPEVHGTKVIPKALLSQFTTFQLGGPCRYLIQCSKPQELQQIIKYLINDKTPFILMGGGSNIVAADKGIDSVVIRYEDPVPSISRHGNDLSIDASTHLDSAALSSVEEGLGGLVFTSGIPGTVGGAVAGNAGAWGKQVGDILKSALIIDQHGEMKEVGPDYFEFTYRNSKIKETGEIIAQVTFALYQEDPKTLAIERAGILKERALKHPDLSLHPCAGSFFRNIEPTSKAEKRQAAGWFLEQAGGKSLRAGGAFIFDKHANIIVKGKDCTALDVYDLQSKMRSIVQEKFGFDLKREVLFLGEFDNIPESRRKIFW